MSLIISHVNSPPRRAPVSKPQRVEKISPREEIEDEDEMMIFDDLSTSSFKSKAEKFKEVSFKEQSLSQQIETDENEDLNRNGNHESIQDTTETSASQIIEDSKDELEEAKTIIEDVGLFLLFLLYHVIYWTRGGRWTR